MPEENNNLVNSLNQIKEAFQKQMEVLEEIKEKADADLLNDLESIERSGYNTILEIEEVRKKANVDLKSKIETNTVLLRAVSSVRDMPRLGNIRF